MLATWEITSEVDGKTFVVTVDRVPNGKDVVRINGQIAAKPLASGDEEALISLGGEPYVVSRTGPDTFTLARDEFADAQMRTQDTARAVLANAPTPIASTGTPLSRLFPIIGWGVAIAAIAAVLLFALPKSYDKIAAQRMRLILIEMQVGKNPDFTRAVQLWGKAPIQMDSMEMMAASNGFDHWRRDKGLYDKPFTQFEVTNSKIVEGEKVPTAIVTFTIDGTEYKARVIRGRPITWEE